MICSIAGRNTSGVNSLKSSIFEQGRLLTTMFIVLLELFSGKFDHWGFLLHLLTLESKLCAKCDSTALKPCQFCLNYSIYCFDLLLHQDCDFAHCQQYQYQMSLLTAEYIQVGKNALQQSDPSKSNKRTTRLLMQIKDSALTKKFNSAMPFLSAQGNL